jgi:hypothetical protein
MEKVQILKNSNAAPSSKTFGDELSFDVFLQWMISYYVLYYAFSFSDHGGRRILKT